MNRNKSNGQYTHSNMDKPCTCGRRLGIHDAEAPYAIGDYSFDPEPNMPECGGFKLDRKKWAAMKAGK